ncbi:hypothetical protein Hamer_G000768 [Homarus americanus]|uniref:Uncharacterized protein n=1 Tax=Homarus americanus TaxID=6706 RepID=A0A8J5N249_HOMAM|nr:hypothetical protein Hamer_G000768 [Homarus americanus]
MYQLGEKVAVPADEYDSVIEELTEDIIQNNHKCYSSIIDKYICLSHGLTPPPTGTEGSQSKLTQRRSLLKFLVEHKPDYSISSKSFKTSNNFECSTSTNPVTEKDFAEEVEETLNSRKIQLGLPENYQLEEEMDVDYGTDSLPSDCQITQNRNDRKIPNYKKNEKENDLQEKKNRHLQDTSESSKKLMKVKSTENAPGKNGHSQRRNCGKAVSQQTEIPVRDIIKKHINCKNNYVSDSTMRKLRAQKKYNQIKNLDDIVQPEIENKDNLAVEKTGCGNNDTATPLKKLIQVRPNNFKIVLLESADAVIIPHLGHYEKKKLAKSMNNISDRNNLPLFSVTFCKNTKEKVPHSLRNFPDAAAKQPVTNKACQEESEMESTLKERGNSCQVRRSKRLKIKLDEKQKTTEDENVHHEHLSPEVKTQHKQVTETHSSPENKLLVFKEVIGKRRGRLKEYCKQDEGRLQATSMKVVSSAEVVEKDSVNAKIMLPCPPPPPKNVNLQRQTILSHESKPLTIRKCTVQIQVLNESHIKQQNDSKKENSTHSEGTLPTLSTKAVREIHNERHELTKNAPSEEHQNDKIVVVNLPKESKTEISSLSLRQGASQPRNKGRLVLNRKLSHSRSCIVFQMRDGNKEKRKRFDILENSLDEKNEILPEEEAVNNTKSQVEISILKPSKTSSCIKRVICQDSHNIHSFLSNKGEKRKLGSRQGWHESQEESIITGINAVKKKRCHSPTHIGAQKISERGRFPDISSIVEDSTLPVSPSSKARKQKVLSALTSVDSGISISQNEYIRGASETFEGKSHKYSGYHESSHMERSKKSLQNQAHKNSQSFWDIDSDEGMETQAQNSTLDRKTQSNEVQHAASSTSQRSKESLADTISCSPNYTILGGERWLAAVKAMIPHKKVL